jgi:DNA-binding MarR family transcriptional regulator
MSPVNMNDEESFLPRDIYIGRLFLQAQRALTRRGIAKLRERGHDRLTLAHTALLHHLDVQGLSVTALAERAGMTKQSMRQLVLDLEDKGYVSRAADPRDRRAAIVTFTEEGRRLLADADQISTELEAECLALLGPERFEALRESLVCLTENDA